jgi:hypothetical protein
VLGKALEINLLRGFEPTRWGNIRWSIFPSWIIVHTSFKVSAMSNANDLDGNTLDADLKAMTRDALIAEITKLRNGIRQHRDCSGHDLCWYHPELWSLLPEKASSTPDVPAWPNFMEGCIRFRKSLDTQLPDAPRTFELFDHGDQ